MKHLLVLIVLISVLPGAAPNDPRKANEAYERGDFEEAVQLYRQAIEQNPDDSRLYFNLGNALLKTGQQQEAMEAFSQSKIFAENALEQSAADYNTGRMLIDQEEFDEAVNYFREALKNNPDDPDAKHNYELALRRQQENQDQQQDQNSDQNQDENQDQDQQNQENNQQQDQNQQQDDQQENNNQQSEPQQNDQEQESSQQPRPQDISRQEAENILNALEQLERDLLENRKKEPTETPSKNEKDW